MLIVAVLLATSQPVADQPKRLARWMTIDNRSGGVLRGVFATPPSDARWGADLARENLRIGKRTKLSLPGTACRRDVRVLLDGRPAEQIFRNRDFCRRPVVLIDGRTNRFLRGSEAPRWN